MKRIYLDNAATTAVHPQVIEKMLPYFTDCYGNASSVHFVGRDARKALEDSRRRVAAVLNCKPQEVYFTSGGTESDNWALKGAAFANRKKGNHIITSAIEHHAILHTCEWLEKQGFEITYVPVDEFGVVNPADVEKAIKDETILVSIMAANNEIGTLQPIKEIAEICHAHKVLFHTDAVQAMGAVKVDVQEIGCDMLSLSAHKFHGPKGVGVLYVKQGTRIENLLHGGAQERSRRATTENVAGIVGLAEALELATADIEGKAAYLTNLRDQLIDGLTALPYVRLNGHRTQRLPGNVNISVRFIEGEALLLRLDMAGIAGSSGSACTSGSLDPSHVLLAIGLPHEIAHGSLRLSLTETNTQEDVDYVLETLPGIISSLRDMSPLYHDFMEAQK
ncbi:MAG: cysteine desulfurase NifS [Clostridia bacterium]|nr:cysteine desulfurase NifS [Clostridia bacterium]